MRYSVYTLIIIDTFTTNLLDFAKKTNIMTILIIFFLQVLKKYHINLKQECYEIEFANKMNQKNIFLFLGAYTHLV